MIINLREKNDGAYIIFEMIKHQRKIFEDDGGDALAFPAHLKSIGVEANGFFITVSDQFELMAKLKYGR